MSINLQFGRTLISRSRHGSFVLAVSVTLGGSVVHAQGPPHAVTPPGFAAAREAIERSIGEGRAASVSIAVIKDGAVVWAEGFGVADRERNIKATADTIYWLASVSKPLTAAGLMQLVERGLIDLDAPANTYLGASKLRSYEGPADAITIRRLANHTAGLPVHNNFFYAGATPPSMDETIRRYGFAALTPGAQNQYSNLAFGILGHVVERLSRMPWSRYQEKYVYDPLGMARTSDHVRAGHEREAAVPYAHDIAGRLVKVEPYDFDHRPASADWSTVRDLARFVRMHLEGGALDGRRVLSAASVREMQRLTGESRPGEGNGVAWFIGQAYGHDAIWHTGGMPGVANVMNIFPKDRAATIVLTNSDDRPLPVEISRHLALGLFGSVPDVQPKSPASPPAASPTPTDSLAGRWTGRLAHPDGDIRLDLTIKDGGAAEVSFAGRPAILLKDVSMVGGTLKGHVQAFLHTQESYHGIPELQFALTLKAGRLSGVCSAFVPSYFTLPYWVDLEPGPANPLPTQAPH